MSNLALPDAVVDEWLRRRPIQARWAGARESGSSHDVFEFEPVESEAKWLGAALAGINQQLMESKLQDRADLEILRDRLEFERLSIVEWQERDLNPWEYPSRIGLALLSVSLRVTPAEQAAVLVTDMLSEIPGLLARARVLPGSTCELGLQLALDTVDRVSGFVQPLARDRTQFLASPPRLRRTLERTADHAARAMEGFREKLVQTRTSTTDSFVDGRERWQLRQRLCEGVSWSPERIVELAELACRPTLGTPTTGDRREGDDTAHGMSEDIEWARSLTERQAPDLLHNDPGVSVHPMPPFLASLYSVAVVASPVLSPTPAPARLFVASGETPADWARRVLAVHECYPGHHVQALFRRRCASRVRRVFTCTTCDEGWAHYCETLVNEWLGVDPCYAGESLRAVRLRAIRAWADVAIHVLGLPRQAAIARFQLEAGLRREEAEREVRRICFQPTAGCAYFIGRIQILDLRSRVSGGDMASTSDFHRRLLVYGSAPIASIARHAFGLLHLGTCQ